jgi:AraC-like DNA-binding protein
MDNLTISSTPERCRMEPRITQPRLREGFAGQDMFVIPRPIIANTLRHPLFRSLYPTDIGWYPAARYHFRERPAGARQDHIMLCVGGHGYVVIDGVENHLRTGNLLVIPRNVRHVYWAAEDAPWSLYWMHFLGEEADYYLERLPVPGSPVPVDRSTQNEAVRLFRDCLHSLEQGYSLESLVYAAQAARHILSLLLFRNHALRVERLEDGRNTQLELIIDLMRTQLAEQFSLKEFAERAGLSVSHFSELFRKYTDHSPMAYFTQLRIRHACRLLDLTAKPVKVVAFESGYVDPYYFSRVFKNVMGIPPERYRSIKKG